MRDGNSYSVELGNSASGNARRIIGVLKNFSTKVDLINSACENIKSRIKRLESLLKSPSEYTDRLNTLETELAEMKLQIELDSADDEYYD